MDLALFDFDGTITTSDTFSAFLRYAVRPRRRVFGGILVSPVVLAYRCRMVTAGTARAIAARVGFRGECAESLRERGRTYAVDVLPALVRPEALRRIAWHQQRGDTVAVVSASLCAYLAPWCDAAGVERICTELEEANGRLTGRYRGGDCSGQRKVERILARYDLSRYSHVFAYGDTIEDREMLALADRKYYRWREISGWHDVSALDVHHPASRA